MSYAVGAISKTDAHVVAGTITVDSDLDSVGTVTGSGVAVTSTQENNIAITGEPQIETLGNNGHGISAVVNKPGGGGAGNISIHTSTLGQIKTQGLNAHGINVTIDSDATITTTGLGARGISAQSSGSGKITVNNTGTISSANMGIYTLSTGEDITVGNTADISVGVWGIYAAKGSSPALATAGKTTITNSGTISAVRGIFVENTLGDVEINNTGNILMASASPGASDWGIAVQHDNAGRSVDQKITVNHSGKIVTNGTDASSIRVYTGALSGSVNITLTNPELISNNATGVKGGLLSNNSSMDYVVNTTGGSITAKGHGIVVISAGSGKAVINNQGTTINSTNNGSSLYSETSGNGNIYISSQNAAVSAISGKALLAVAGNTSTGNLYIGYDGSGNVAPITGQLSNQNSEVIMASHSNNGDILINVGDNTTIESQSTTGGLGRGILAYRPSVAEGASATAAGGNTSITVGKATINTSNASNAEGIYAYNVNSSLMGGKIVIDSQATITTNGASSASGIRVNNAGQGDVFITQKGDISTAGSTSAAIRVSAVKDSAVQIGYVEGGGAQAITGKLTTKGNNSAGILVSNAAAGAKTMVLSGAQIDTTGSSSHGISVNSRTADIKNTAAISTVGSSAHGISVFSNQASATTAVENNGHISSTGADASGIYIFQNSPTATATVRVVNSGEINGGTGINIVDAISGAVINSGTITATEASGYAINLSSSNITTTLQTGSVLGGDVYSDNTGNTLVFQGTATEDSSFLSSDVANNFTSLTVNTDGLTNTSWTLTGDATQIAAVDAVAITNGANNTTGALTLAPATSADYAFTPLLSGNGTLIVNLADSTKQFNFTNAGNAFGGTLEMKNSTFLLDNTGETTLTNGTLKLSAGGMTELNQDRTIGGLTFNGGGLKIDFTPNTTTPKGTLTVAQLDATGGGTLATNVPASIDTSATPHANFLDYSLDPANSQIKVVSATGSVSGVGTQLALTDYAGQDLSTGGFESTIVNGGDTLGTAKFGYIGAVKNDGVWLGFGLKELQANAGKNILIDNLGATGDTLGAQLTGSGGFEFNSQPGTIMNIGNASSNYAGETIVDGGGTVKLIADNALGNTSVLTIKTDSTMDMNGTSLVLNGDFIGQGASTLRLNSGKLTLNSTQNSTAGQLIADGTLIIGESSSHNQAHFTGNLDMPNTSLLGGHGQVNGLVTLKNGSTISPGSSGASIGTLTVGQIDFQNGSTYLFEAYPDGSADKIAVSSTLGSGNGSATINDATLNVLGGGGTWKSDVTYTVLTADGGVSGIFETVNKDMPFLDHQVLYTPNDVQLIFVRNDVSFPEIGEGHNQNGAGSGVESLGPNDPLYQQIVSMNTEQARNAFDNLSGEIHGSIKSAMLTNSRYARDAVNQHLGDNGNLTTQIDDGKNLWVSMWGHDGHLKTDGNAARLNNKGYGVLVGVDTYSTEQATVGVALGYEKNNLEIASARNSNADVDAIHLLGYGRATAGSIDIKGGIGYSWLNADTTRRIVVGNIRSKNEASYNGGLLQLFVEGSHTFEVGDAYSVTPYAGLAYQRVKMDNFTEKGTAAQLHGNGNSSNMVSSTLGVRGNWSMNEMTNLYADMGWQHSFGRSAPQTNLNFMGGDRYNVKGVQTNRNAALLGVGANIQIKPNMNLSVGYEGLFGNQSLDHAAKLRWEIRF